MVDGAEAEDEFSGVAMNWKLQLIEEQPEVLICYCRNRKCFYTVSGKTGKVIGANESKRVR